MYFPSFSFNLPLQQKKKSDCGSVTILIRGVLPIVLVLNAN